jgi:hypothetical protein
MVSIDILWQWTRLNLDVLAGTITVGGWIFYQNTTGPLPFSTTKYLIPLTSSLIFRVAGLHAPCISWISPSINPPLSSLFARKRTLLWHQAWSELHRMTDVWRLDKATVLMNRIGINALHRGNDWGRGTRFLNKRTTIDVDKKRCFRSTLHFASEWPARAVYPREYSNINSPLSDLVAGKHV